MKETGRQLLSHALNGDLESLRVVLKEQLSEGNIKISDVVHPKTGDGLIHVAARGGHVPCIQYLLENGIKVNQKNFEFKTALHEAAQFGQEDAVSSLLAAALAASVADSLLGIRGSLWK